MTKVEVIVYALSFAFVCKQAIVPFVKKLVLGRLERYYNRIKRNIPKDDMWVENISAINQYWNDRRKNIVSMQYKPFECIKCMTMWTTLALCLIAGIYEEIGLVGIVGLAAGMLFEGILMRYL